MIVDMAMIAKIINKMLSIVVVFIFVFFSIGSGTPDPEGYK